MIGIFFGSTTGTTEELAGKIAERLNVAASDVHNVGETQADKQRASYYDYYATATWGAVDNYDLCVDTGAVGVDGAVDVIAQFVELQEKFRQEKQ